VSQKEECVTCFVRESQVWEGEIVLDGGFENLSRNVKVQDFLDLIFAFGKWRRVGFTGFCQFFSKIAFSVAIEFRSCFVDAQYLDLIIIYNIFRQWKCRFAHQIKDEEYVAN